MAFQAIFEGVFTLLQQDPLLVPTILGPRTVTNMRLYRGWPAMQNLLTGYEPNQPAEGWLVLEEPEVSRYLVNRQVANNHEYLDLAFHVYATTFATAHDALDRLDTYFHWEIQQQREVQWAEFILLFTRRAMQADKYEQAVKLYQKDIVYTMEFVRDEAIYP